MVEGKIKISQDELDDVTKEYEGIKSEYESLLLPLFLWDISSISVTFLFIVLGTILFFLL